MDSSLTLLNNIPTPSNSLTCDANGILYGGSAWGLYTYDTQSGITTALGFLGYALAGDLTYRDNKLYGTTFDNEFIEIDPNDLSATQVIFEYPLPQGYFALGVVSDVNSCDSATTYITVTNQLATGFPDTVNQIYAIDPVAQTATLVCETPWIIYGAATPTEFLASDCSVRLDLDADDSAGLPGSDWQAALQCGGGISGISDTDAVFYSGYRVDSLRLRLLPGAPDWPDEFLTAAGSAQVGVVGQGTPWLTLSNLGAAQSGDFQAALLTAQWRDTAAAPTAGPRTLEVIAFCSGGRTDTAFAYLPVQALLAAGQDTAGTLCADASPLALDALLSAGAAVGGAWPTLPGGVFDPAVHPEGDYLYVIDNGQCPPDTATVTLSLLPLPVFSLGADTAFCAGETLALLAPGLAQWQDGSVAPSFTANQAGLYWAEMESPEGCRFRDSVLVAVQPPVQTAATQSLCAGQTLSWNGHTIATDTTLCATFPAANGCDSTHCLSAGFFYPGLSLDTAICAGQTLAWQGQSYGSAGFFQDTVWLNGCLTALALNLQFSVPDTIPVAAAICDGDVYVVGDESFAMAGQYLVALNGSQGCDSLVELTLSVLPAVDAQIVSIICPGDSFLFNGEMLDTPGFYEALFQTSAGCDSTVTLTLGWLPAPMPGITGDTFLCAGQTGQLSVDGNFAAWQWSNSAHSPAVEIGAAGAYAVTVTDANGCQGADSILVTVGLPIEMDWATADPICPGDSTGFVELTALAGGLPPVVFQLGNDPPTDTPFFNNLYAGAWTIVATDAAGCTASWQFMLTDPPVVTLTLGQDATIQAGETYAIPLEISPAGVYQYAWQPPAGLSCADCANPLAMPADSTVYTVTVTDSGGCTATDSVAVRVLKALGIYVPTAFSSDGDGLNDVFEPLCDAAAVDRIVLFQVYNRWGELVFERKNAADDAAGWDGTFRGKYLPPDVFAWYAEIRLRNGEAWRKWGEVTLLR